MKVLAIGDIHTKTWIIEAVKKQIDNYDAVVFVGDYADDWNATPIQTIETWKALKAFQEKYPKKVNLVLGNHDYIYLNKTPSISSGYNQTTQMLLNTPDNADLKKWLNKIPLTKVVDKVTYSHAGLTDGWEYDTSVDNLWRDNSVLWVRPGAWVVYDTSMPQVFGHTPSATCNEIQPNIWCIDTFSTMFDGEPIGDRTVLEVINGKTFNKIPLA